VCEQYKQGSELTKKIKLNLLKGRNIIIKILILPKDECLTNKLKSITKRWNLNQENILILLKYESLIKKRY
jgi:hypothetical protein